ncbi:MAG: signal recognition particle protein [Clostridia bacterium]|nr:signal recognition particle protein [Clostridia bacterium]
MSNLSEKLQGVFKKLRGKGKISEADLKEGMREVKLALLEADVNFKVVKEFIASVTERASGAEVMESLTPGQQIVKIVNEELTSLMGGENAKISISSKPPTVIMMTGLQGAGKTTTAGKLGGMFKKQGRRPLLVACDVYRPAAIDQLCVVGEKLEIPVFKIPDSKNPVDISKKAIEHAKKYGNDIVIIDTAGRLHIDEDLMQELKNIKSSVNINETLLVVDAMTGQDASNVAQSFNEQLEIDGVILTKLDGDARGGAALSVRKITGKPIKFIGAGEKLEDFEPFYPDRMASRILGMGDVLSLIEKAEQAFDEKKALELEEKLRKQQFDLDDFLDQMEQMKKMGPLENLLGMIPGIDAKALQGATVDEKKLAHIEAIIKSMTKKERSNPSIINSSRKRRIAAGSGTNVQQVNALLKQFEQMQKMVKQFGKMNKKGAFRKMKFPLA